MFNGIWLSHSFCTHVTLYALSICPFEHQISVHTDDQMGVQIFWVPRSDTFQQAYQEEWEQEDDDPSHIHAEESRTDTSHDRSPQQQRLRVCMQLRTTGGMPHVKYQLLVAVLPYRNRLGNLLVTPMSQQSSGSTQKLKKNAVFWVPLGAPVPLKTRVGNFIHPVQFGILPNRLPLPYPDAEILLGYEEDVSSIRDGFSVRVKLRRHIVDAKGTNLAFREAPVRKHAPSKEEHRFDTDVPDRLTEQKRLSIYNWNPGPRREKKKGAIEKHIAEKWHAITLQEAIEYLDREYLTNRFYVIHYGDCAILFNKDTFQGVISRASFRRLPRSGKSFFTTMSLHINNLFVKKRGIGKKLLLASRAVMLEERLQRCRLAPPVRERSQTRQYH